MPKVGTTNIQYLASSFIEGPQQFADPTRSASNPIEDAAKDDEEPARYDRKHINLGPGPHPVHWNSNLEINKPY